MTAVVLYYVCSMTLGVALSSCVLCLCRNFPKSGNRKMFFFSFPILLFTTLPFFIDVVHGISSTLAIREEMSVLIPIPSPHSASQMLCIGFFYMLTLLLGLPSLNKRFDVKASGLYTMLFLLETVWFASSMLICLSELQLM